MPFQLRGRRQQDLARGPLSARTPMLGLGRACHALGRCATLARTVGRDRANGDRNGWRRQPVSEEGVAREAGEATADQHPTDFVAGVIDDRGGFDAAIRDLSEAGFDESYVEIRYGQAGIDAFTSRPRHWLGDLLSDGSDYQDRLAEDLRDGHYAIRVRIQAPLDDQRTLAKDILRRNGGHHIVSAGRWSFETDPDFPPVR